MSETPKRYFTVEEANRTLPLVSRVVGDIVREYRTWQGKVERYELMVGANSVEETQEVVALRGEIEESARRINEFVSELEPIGCMFKGFETGLVDYYSVLDERDVFLCWRLGEPDIRHWHEIEDGFAGRQELAPVLSPEED